MAGVTGGTYRAPVLIRLGSVAALTLNDTAGSRRDNQGNNCGTNNMRRPVLGDFCT